MEIDALDRRLIDHLRHDARASITTIARLLGVTRATAQARLSRLVERGIIRRFTVELRNAESEDRIQAVMLIAVQGAQARRVIAELRKRPEVRSVHSTNGIWDLVAEIETESLAAFDRALAVIREIGGITNSHTCLLLNRAL